MMIAQELGSKGGPVLGLPLPGLVVLSLLWAWELERMCFSHLNILQSKPSEMLSLDAEPLENLLWGLVP